MGQITWDTSAFMLLNLVFVLGLPCCNAEENELCYLKQGKTNAGICVAPRQDVPCCPEHLADIKVTVYKGHNEDKCDHLNACGSNTSCCSRSLLSNVTLAHSEVLKKSFSINCFRYVTPTFLVTSMPDSNGLELVVVSYTCSDSYESTALHVSITCTLIVISISAIVFGIYLYRRLVNSDATLIPPSGNMSPQSNNDHIPPSGNMSPQSNNDHIQTSYANDTYANVVPPTYEWLLRHTNDDGEYSEVAVGC